jgi:hypothetical protein
VRFKALVVEEVVDVVLLSGSLGIHFRCD